MDSTILLFLLQDGVTNGAIYALLALALVLVFAVTRVILVPQGEFVTYGALTLAMLDLGQGARHGRTAHRICGPGAGGGGLEPAASVFRSSWPAASPCSTCCRRSSSLR